MFTGEVHRTRRMAYHQPKIHLHRIVVHRLLFPSFLPVRRIPDPDLDRIIVKMGQDKQVRQYLMGSEFPTLCI